MIEHKLIIESIEPGKKLEGWMEDDDGKRVVTDIFTMGEMYGRQLRSGVHTMIVPLIGEKHELGAEAETLRWQGTSIDGVWKFREFVEPKPSSYRRSMLPY